MSTSMSPGFTFVTNQVILARNAGALYNYGLGNATMSQFAASADLNASLNTVYQNSIGARPTAEVAKILVANLGITGSSATAAEAYVVGQLNPVAVNGRGKVINDILSAFSNLTGDPTFGSFATAFNKQVDAAVKYAAKVGNPDTNWATAIADSTFMLTASAAEVNEGGTAVFTLDTKGVSAGSQYSYVIKGSGVTSADVAGGALSGTATVGADGKAIIAVSLTNDTLTEGDETMTLEIAGKSASVTVKDTSVSPPSSIVLTNALNPSTGGADNVVGTSGNDRIFGVVDTSGTAASFTAGDVIDGGAGNDTLDLTMVGTGAGPSIGGLVSSVETISVSNTNSISSSLDLSNVTGSTAFKLTSGLDGTTLTVNNLAKLVDVEMAGNGGLTMGYLATAVAGTADTQKLTLNGLNPALSTSTSNRFTANGIETLNVTGAKDSKVSVAGSTLKTINLDGAATVRVATAEATVTTMDASNATGNVTLVSTGAGITKMVGGAGNDSLAPGLIARTVSIDGGAGSDTLSVTNTTFSSDALANVKNVETVALGATAAVTLDVKAVAGLSTVVSRVTQTAATVAAQETVVTGLGATGAALLTYVETSSGNATTYATAANAANASTVTVDNLTSGSTFTIESRGLKALYETDPTAFDLLGQGAVSLSVFQASNASNTSDSLTVVMDNNSTYSVKNTALGAASAAKNLYVVDSVTLPNVEKVSLVSNGAFGGNQITNLTIANASTVEITGSANLNIGNGSTITTGIDVSNLDAVTLDASAFTGRPSLSTTSSELANFTGGIKGGTGADTLTVFLTADGAVVDAASTSIEAVLARVTADVTGSIDFSGFAGATTKRVTLAANSSGSDTVTIQGLSSGDTLQLQGTHGTDALAIVGAGSGSSLKLDFSQDTSAAFVTGSIALSRVADLSINTTRLDGTDSNVTVAQQATTFTGGIDSTTLKVLKVTGIQDAANVLTLGSVQNSGGVSLLDSVDLSGFAGSLANGGLALDTTAGSKGVVIKLNKATGAGTAGTLIADNGGTGFTATATSSGIALGAGEDKVVLDSSLNASLVLSNFTPASLSNISTPMDIIDFRALGVGFSDLTFTDFSTIDTNLVDDANNAVQIAINGTTSVIQISGVVSANLSTANFLFA